jgi:hypothetical protein
MNTLISFIGSKSNFHCLDHSFKTLSLVSSRRISSFKHTHFQVKPKSIVHPSLFCAHFSNNVTETVPISPTATKPIETASTGATPPPTSFYRRPLPATVIAFSSPIGKQIFREALDEGFMEGAEQYNTQQEPACKPSHFSLSFSLFEE